MFLRLLILPTLCVRQSFLYGSTSGSMAREEFRPAFRDFLSKFTVLFRRSVNSSSVDHSSLSFLPRACIFLV